MIFTIMFYSSRMSRWTVHVGPISRMKQRLFQMKQEDNKEELQPKIEIQEELNNKVQTNHVWYAHMEEGTKWTFLRLFYSFFWCITNEQSFLGSNSLSHYTQLSLSTFSFYFLSYFLSQLSHSTFSLGFYATLLSYSIFSLCFFSTFLQYFLTLLSLYLTLHFLNPLSTFDSSIGMLHHMVVLCGTICPKLTSQGPNSGKLILLKERQAALNTSPRPY